MGLQWDGAELGLFKLGVARKSLVSLSPVMNITYIPPSGNQLGVQGVCVVWDREPPSLTSMASRRMTGSTSNKGMGDTMASKSQASM